MQFKTWSCKQALALIFFTKSIFFQNYSICDLSHWCRVRMSANMCNLLWFPFSHRHNIVKLQKPWMMFCLGLSNTGTLSETPLSISQKYFSILIFLSSILLWCFKAEKDKDIILEGWTWNELPSFCFGNNYLSTLKTEMDFKTLKWYGKLY